MTAMEIQSKSLFPHLKGERAPAYILHVEDDRADALLARRTVYSIRHTKYEYYIDRATSIAEARQALTSKKYAAILLDLGLAGVEELESFDILSKEAPEIPIIILTGAESKLLELQAGAKGAKAWLHKKNLTENPDLIAKTLAHVIDGEA